MQGSAAVVEAWLGAPRYNDSIWSAVAVASISRRVRWGSRSIRRGSG